MQFYFKDNSQSGINDYHTLIFVNAKAIFTLNFRSQQIEEIHYWTINIEFQDQPSFFTLSDDQRRCCVASRTDGVWYDIDKDFEVDLDELHNIKRIQGIFYDVEEEFFYLVANE